MTEGGEGREVDVVVVAVADQVRLCSHCLGVVVDLIDLRTDCGKCCDLLQVVDLIVTHT